MEGVTGFVFRNLHHEMFPGASRYYTPFLSANHTHSFKSKEMRDIDPAVNRVPDLIPQLLTNSPEDFLWAAERLFLAGYRQIDLNLGCPSSTVTAKKKGAGFLAYPDLLDSFFEKIFNSLASAKDSVRISVKTRLGMNDPSESAKLMKIYNRYPICELVIHARVREDFYKGKPRLETFASCLEESRHPVCYNGDIFSCEDYINITEMFPGLSAVMIGRGLISDPALILDIKAYESGRVPAVDRNERQKLLMEFHDRLFEEYCRAMAPKDAVFHLKEVWYYMSRSFPGREKEIRKMLKAKNPDDYVSAAARFRNCLFS